MAESGKMGSQMAAQLPDDRVVERMTCRACDSPSLSRVMDMGPQCIAGVFPGAGTAPEPDRFPLELVRCDRDRDPNACGLVQLRHTVRADLLYDEYWYRSGINKTMTSNLHDIAAQAVEMLGGLDDADLVLDIGCNDGTLLDGFKKLSPHGAELVGIDPSDVTRYAVSKGYRVIREFFTSTAFRREFAERKATVVTSIAMFYDLEDPNAFVRDIYDVLADQGVWIAEFSYLPTMLERASFDTVCHEHLEYYSLEVIESILKKGGLELISAELNEVNGGSIRFFAHKAGSPVPPGISDEGLSILREQERILQLGSSQPYEQFVRRCESVRSEVVDLLRDLKNHGKRVHLYGASTKGNTLLQYCGIGSDLVDIAADRNPDKWGLETIGSHIPIVSEQESRSLRPDYYFVLPWHFLTEMLEREEEFLSRGGQFIVPLPRVRLVGGA